MQKYSHPNTYSLYRYASARVESLREQGLLRPHSALAKWEPVTPSEMEGFFGIVLNMGLIDMPELQDYWSTHWITHVPFFSHVMPRRRFLNILWLLHVSYERDGSPPRRIDKVKSFLDPLLHNFQSHYRPSQNLSGGETMVGHVEGLPPGNTSQANHRNMG